MRLAVENNTVAQRGRAIMTVLGSFWTEIHRDRLLWRTYGRGLGEFLAQRYVDFLYGVNTLGRKTMPETRTITWRRLVILESALATSQAGMLKYGDGAVYCGPGSGDVTLYVYGGRSSSNLSQLDVAAACKHAVLMSNAPVEPSAVLMHGTDFWFDTTNHSLVFRTNPFNNSAMPIVIRYDAEGRQEDRELSLWVWESQDDLEDMSERFGVLLGLQTTSSAAYSRLINAALDSLTSGASHLYLRQFFCAAAGIRPVINATETVTDIARTDRNLVVVTDREAYLFAATAEVAVSVGDVVHAGDILADTVAVLRTPEELATLPGLTLAKLFNTPLRNAIAFPNEDMPLTVTTVGGRTRVAVGLYGDPATVNWFWRQVHARGVAASQTLAGFLQFNDTGESEPGVRDLPNTVNPFALLLREFSGEFMVVKLKPGDFVTGFPEVQALAVLRNLLPPRFTCLALVERTMDIDYITLNETPTSDTPGVTETVADHIGVAMVGEEIGLLSEVGAGQPAYTDIGPTAWIVNDPCAG